jgi:sec-independent protein translocase protein TatA
MPLGIGPLELIIVLVIALLVLGPGKLPEVGSALGKSIREFRKAATDVQEATRIDTPSSPSPTPVTPAPMPQAPTTPPVPTSPTAAESVQPVGAPVSNAPAPEPNTLSGQSAPNEISTGPKA